MACREETADRIVHLPKRRKGVTERKMFGGIAFLYNGHMCCGVNGDDLMLRLGNSDAAQAVTEPHTRPMDFTGRPLKSTVYVDPAGYGSHDDLCSWVHRALQYAKTPPAK